MDKQYQETMEKEINEGTLILPNSCTLYWKRNEVGGRMYYSDEIPCGVIVWDTCCVQDSTLLAAIVKELQLYDYEKRKNK